MDYASVADLLGHQGWIQPPAASAPAPVSVMPPDTHQWRKTQGVASSKHGIPGNWTETHPYTRATRDTDGPFQLGVGEYRNSEGEQSLYGGLIGRHGPLFAELGVATGYSGAPVVPFPRAGIELSDLARLFIAPAYDQHSGAAGPVVGLDMDFMRF